MRLRHVEVLMMLLITIVCVATVVFTFLFQQREIEHLNRNLMEARQEIAQKTNRLYEVSHEMEMLKAKTEKQE